MRATTLGLFFVCVAMATAAAAAEKPVHVFILSGQSNMAGMNPKSGFEPEAEQLFSDGEVVYFKVAKGGRPIRNWVTQWGEIAQEHGIDVEKVGNREVVYYQPILEQYRKILEKHPNPASVTFCWMQGERDAREKLHAAYGPALEQLIANLRKDLKQPNMYFVIGRLSDFGKESNKPWQHVRKAQVETAEADPRGAWVDCDDLNNKQKNGKLNDDLHYTAEGYELLGRRYARQAKAMIDGKKPASDGRPK